MPLIPPEQPLEKRIILPNQLVLSGIAHTVGLRSNPSTSGRPLFITPGTNRQLWRIVGSNLAGDKNFDAHFGHEYDAWRFWCALTSDDYLPRHLCLLDPGPLPSEFTIWAYVNVSTFGTPLNSSTTYNIPNNWWNKNNIGECLGGGGSAGGSFIAGFAGCCVPIFSSPGGGAGAAYAFIKNISLTRGGTTSYVIGSGGSPQSSGQAGLTGNPSSVFGGTIVANGGAGGPISGTAAGGTTGSGNSGGNGAPSAATSVGQGGGGAGGPHGAGRAGSGQVGGAGDAGFGGAGGGGTGTDFQSTSTVGAGGGGNGASSGNGGNGGLYGAGAGGGELNPGGAGHQGVVAIAYTQFTFSSGFIM